MTGTDQSRQPQPRRLAVLFALLLIGACTLVFRIEWIADGLRLRPVLGWTVALLLGGMLLALPIWIWRGRGEPLVLPRLGARRVSREFLIALPLVFVVLFASGALRWVLASLAGTEIAPTAMKSAIEHSEGPNFVVLVFAACVLAPIGEELFFRKFLFEELKPWFGTAVAVALQAMFFAAFHVYEGIDFLAMYVLIALLLQLIYRWRRTLLAPVLVHGMFNSLMIAAVAIMASLPKPYLGITFDLDSERCKIDRVAEESAAMEAGLLAGDVIVSFDSQPIDHYADLLDTIRTCQPGERVWIELVRDGEGLRVEAVLGSRPDQKVFGGAIPSPED